VFALSLHSQNRSYIMKNIFLFILALIMCAANAQTDKPVLTLNTEMHTGMANRISTDKDGKYLLTCLDDKTGKLWNAATGELLRTFHVPIREGDEGKLYACALSPDGRIAAMGGWTGYDWVKKYSIYIFNVQTGTMMEKLNGLKNTINDLEFSRDGRYLAAGLGGSSGVCIFSTSTWTLIASLTGYRAAVYNVAFDTIGRLATVCLNGNVRLYSSFFQLMKEQKTSGGQRTYSLAFSPDGQKIAVGYYDSPKIQVLDGETLETIYEPDNTEATTVDSRLEMLTFSYDGSYLFAGGYYSKQVNDTWWFHIRKWNDAGRGTYSDYPACLNVVADIKPMPDNSIVYCGGYPDLGRISGSGQQVFYKSAETNDLRAQDGSHFRINYNGTEVGFTPFSKTPLTFSVASRLLSLEQSSGISPTDNAAGITVTNWNNSETPKLNGSALNFLKTDEFCESVDISTTGSTIVLGADWSIYSLSAQGTKVWEIPVPGAAVGVNIAGNNSVVAAAHSDGTIRWYRMSDGKNILSLFAHPDNKRWILWTPSGYYDCSPGAEDLIGWHVNNGINKEASYYPASRFRSTYYRPDVIDHILETLDEDRAVQVANEASNRTTRQTDITKMLPPTVTITNLTDNQEIFSTTVTIEYNVESPNNEPILSIKAFIDGRPIETQRGLKVVHEKNQIVVTVPARNVQLSVIAENRFGFSEPAKVNLQWKGAVQLVAAFKPTLYVLAVGISQYTDPDLKLDLASKDARDFSAVLKRQNGLLYKDVQVKLLADADATKDNILDGLDWIQRQTTNHDVAILFLAGHGMNDASGAFYFLPVGANVDRIKSSCLMFAEIQNTISSMTGKVVVFADACHSGNIMGKRRAVPDINGMVNELSSAENGAIVFTSSTGKQYSLEDASWGNGAFTKALVEGLSGKADLQNTGSITVKALDYYVAERVKNLTDGKQSPTTIIPGGVPDFPIAAVK